MKDLSVLLHRVEASNLTPLLWGIEVFLDPIKEGTMGHSVRPQVAVKGLSVHLRRVEDNVSAHPLLATVVFLGPTKGGTMVAVLGSEVHAFRCWVSS